jgi:hypothetical protein
MNTRESVVAETLMLSSGRALLDIPSKVASRASHPKLVQFIYTNWKGQTYNYVVKPESIEFAPYDTATHRQIEGAEPRWLFHGEVVTRDGDTRPNMGTRRRSFLLYGMRQLEIMGA